MAKNKNDEPITFGKEFEDEEEIRFAGRNFDDDDDWYDEDEPVCPGVSIHVNLNININSVDELEKVEPIIDRLAEKYGYNWG